MNNATETVYRTITPKEFEEMTGMRFSLQLVVSLIDDEDELELMQDTELYQFEIEGREFSYDSYLNEIDISAESITATYI
jgi:hypothetical protein